MKKEDKWQYPHSSLFDQVDLLLSDYEEVAAQAVDNGIDLTTQASLQ